MLIQLPMETWMEILSWLRRRDLVKKLDRLWDREFTPMVQDWLHKYTRNVSMRELAAQANGLHVCLYANNWDHWDRVPFAEVDLPENVTDFKWITISHFDSNVMTLLRRMRPLLQNICLFVYPNVNPVLQTILHHLMPILNSNNSIRKFSSTYKSLPFFSANYPTAFFNVKTLCAWDYEYDSDDIEPMLTWLFTRREDGEPRLLLLRCANTGFYEKIRKHFLDSVRQYASPFFINFYLGGRSLTISASVTENTQTGEQLSVQQYVDNNQRYGYGLITCCPRTIAPELFAKNNEERIEKDYCYQNRVIELSSPQIGSIDAEEEQQLMNDDDDNIDLSE